jgi:hypothetical protein
MKGYSVASVRDGVLCKLFSQVNYDLSATIKLYASYIVEESNSKFLKAVCCIAAM